jgi:hypothetical protein
MNLKLQADEREGSIGNPRVVFLELRTRNALLTNHGFFNFLPLFISKR